MVAALAFSSGVASADFVYPDFSSTTGLTPVGTAAQSGTKERLTTNGNLKVGGVWRIPKENVVGAWTTQFQFQTSSPTSIVGGAVPNEAGADGFAFVLQNSAAAPIGSNGQGIGYAGIVDSVAVELDTFFNTSISTTFFGTIPSNGDPDGNHVAVQTGGTGANSSDHNVTFTKGLASLPTATLNMSDGGVHTAKISYTPGTMTVFIDNLVIPVLTVPIDLSSTITTDANGNGFVGLTSATGLAAENHDILNWSFVTVPEPTTLSLVGVAVAGVLGRRRSLFLRSPQLARADKK